jgi:hypothetical protein
VPESTQANQPLNRPALGRRLIAEFLGTGLLVAVVIGSGIAAQQLSPGDTGLQLLQNSLTTVFGLAVLILLFWPHDPDFDCADFLVLLGLHRLHQGHARHFLGGGQ